jgi:hypothetical protein
MKVLLLRLSELLLSNATKNDFEDFFGFSFWNRTSECWSLTKAKEHLKQILTCGRDSMKHENNLAPSKPAELASKFLLRKFWFGIDPLCVIASICLQEHAELDVQIELPFLVIEISWASSTFKTFYFRRKRLPPFECGGGKRNSSLLGTQNMARVVSGDEAAHVRKAERCQRRRRRTSKPATLCAGFSVNLPSSVSHPTSSPCGNKWGWRWRPVLNRHFDPYCPRPANWDSDPGAQIAASAPNPVTVDLHRSLNESTWLDWVILKSNWSECESDVASIFLLTWASIVSFSLLLIKNEELTFRVS